MFILRVEFYIFLVIHFWVLRWCSKDQCYKYICYLCLFCTFSLCYFYLSSFSSGCCSCCCYALINTKISNLHLCDWLRVLDDVLICTEACFLCDLSLNACIRIRDDDYARIRDVLHCVNLAFIIIYIKIWLCLCFQSCAVKRNNW